MVLCIFIDLCRHHHNQYQITFISSPRSPLAVTSCSPNSSPLLHPEATTKIPSISVDLNIPDLSYKWNHTLCILLWLASSTRNDVLKVHPYYSTNHYFIPFYWQVIFHCVDMLHFICSFITWWIQWYFCITTGTCRRRKSSAMCWWLYGTKAFIVMYWSHPQSVTHTQQSISHRK